MGKAKKIKVSQGGTSQPKLGLAEQIEGEKLAKSKNRMKIRFRNDNEDQKFVDSKITRKILTQARKQLQEVTSQDDNDNDDPTSSSLPKPRITRLGSNPSDDDDDDEASSDHEDLPITGNEYYEDFTIAEEDERALQLFMDHDRQPTRTLADIIMEKLTEKKTELDTQLTEADSLQMQEIDPRVQLMYKGVRDVLAKYRSGKIPKAFKVVPSLRNWEQILYITDPAGWSAAAMYQATRIFASNLKERMAQRFYNLVLLPRIRDDIAEYKRLNFHLYQALRKALFKPAAFMKGIILPLLESGTCTLREAIIVGSVVAKNSIPFMHSAAALLKIAEMGYTGANSIMIRILLDKKYALPYQVVDALVFHFLRFENDKREMPVLWHQSLLTFAQRYKGRISTEQKEMLYKLLKKQSHPTLTAEIRRELQSAQPEDVEMDGPADEAME